MRMSATLVEALLTATEMDEGQVSTGPSESPRATFMVTVVAPRFPLASVARTVTDWPFPADSVAGVKTTLATEVFSATEHPVFAKVRAPLEAPTGSVNEVLLGQVTTGSYGSVTVTLTVVLLLLPAPSVAVTVTT